MKLEEILRIAERNLAAAGYRDARREARRLLAAVLESDEGDILAGGERGLSEEEQQACFIALARREVGEPLSRIIGRREFWSLPFTLTPAVLDPRPDSETLIEAALSDHPDRERAYRVLDLGTGSGCLLLALLSELPNATGVGLDISKPALAVAARNAADLGLGARTSLRHSDWTEKADGAFDIILCNPPYVSEAEYRALERSVTSFDPRLALVPGPIWQDGYEATGLEAYEAIVPRLPKLMNEGARAYLEIGHQQAEAVAAIAKSEGFDEPRLGRDLAGNPRCLTLLA